MGSPTDVTDPHRGSRTFHHKVRTGCLNCKRRRIKCDETKPVCIKCRASSLVCEGYKPPKAWVFEPSSKGPSNSDFEQHLLSYSQGDGIKYMTLYAKSTEHFFKIYAPQMAHAHPAAKHALLGLSAQYQASMNHISPNGSLELATKYRTDALLNYNRGMKALARSNQRQLPLEVLVSCCLLFTAVELWPQKDMAPHVHILHALRICQFVPTATVHSDTLAGYLLRILLFLAENVASYNDDFTEASLNITDAYIEAPWPIPTFFQDPVEAQEHVDKLLKRVARLDALSAGEGNTRHQRLWDVHGQLSLAIEASRQQAPGMTATYHDLRSLQLHLGVIRVMLKTNTVQDEMVFDGCWEDFGRILCEAEELLAYELQPGSARGPASVRSSLGLISPLFMVATKCRDPAIRHRALELLHGSRRRERSWNSCVASILARIVIDAEEDSTSMIQSLPQAEQRVCLSHVEFDREQAQMKTQYKRIPWDAHSEEKTITKPWIPSIDDNYETVTLSNKSLRAYGYTGTILISPRISCQCLDDGKV